jgi:hypothetical protein
MTTATTMERAADTGGNRSIFFHSGQSRPAWPCPPAVRHERERTAVERDAWRMNMQTTITREQYRRRLARPTAKAYREITAAIQRVRDEGRTIIREVPTMPERILAWECPTCGPTIRQDSNGWHTCRHCGANAVRREWVRPDKRTAPWRSWRSRTGQQRSGRRPWYVRPATTINRRV